jgi:hypothetical protein
VIATRRRAVAAFAAVVALALFAAACGDSDDSEGGAPQHCDYQYVT